MSGRNQYEPEEWKKLNLLAASGILYKVNGISRGARSLSGVVVILRELVALGSFLAASLEKYGRHELLKDLINDLKERSKIKVNAEEEEETQTEIEDLDALVAEVNAILAEKADEEEAQAYRAFVYELAFEVANASGDGFLGMGTKINAKEAVFLHDLKSLLLEN